jgi:hypothetical protein
MLFLVNPNFILFMISFNLIYNSDCFCTYPLKAPLNISCLKTSSQDNLFFYYNAKTLCKKSFVKFPIFFGKLNGIC